MMVLCESVPLSLKISSFTHITKHLGAVTRALAVTCFHSERLTPTEPWLSAPGLSVCAGPGLPPVSWRREERGGLPQSCTKLSNQ